MTTQAKHKQRSGPLRTVIACEQASDGLGYELLECQHRVLLVANIYGVIDLTSKRRCPRCPRGRAAKSTR